MDLKTLIRVIILVVLSIICSTLDEEFKSLVLDNYYLLDFAFDPVWSVALSSRMRHITACFF